MDLVRLGNTRTRRQKLGHMKQVITLSKQLIIPVMALQPVIAVVLFYPSVQQVHISKLDAFV